MTQHVHSVTEIENSTRREFLAQLRALGGLVLVASIPGVLKAEDQKQYGADAMPHGWRDDPLAFVAIGSDGIVTIMVHRSDMGQGVRTGMPLIISCPRGCSTEVFLSHGRFKGGRTGQRSDLQNISF